jgi:HPr kinase/phosphorylase
MPQISVEQLFSDNQGKLNLGWAAGKSGGNRVITGDSALRPTVGLVGHMNFIHPFRVQVLGTAEFNYLNALSPEALSATIDRLFSSTCWKSACSSPAHPRSARASSRSS